VANCKVSIDINAPVESVWLLTQNPNRRPEWDFRIKKAELLDASLLQKGAKLRSRGSLFGSFEIEIVYVTVEPNKRSAVKVQKFKGLPFVSGAGSWRYTKLDEGRCKFETHLIMNTKDSWAGKLLDRIIMQPFLLWMTNKSLKKLKYVAERDYSKEQKVVQ